MVSRIPVAVFEMFSALGGLGIAGFAIFTELMASAERQYLEGRRQIAKEIQKKDARYLMLSVHGEDMAERIPWIVVRSPSGVPVFPSASAEDGRDDWDLMIREPFLGVSVEGFARESTAPYGKGATYWFWPATPAVAHKAAVSEVRTAIARSGEAVAASITEREIPPWFGQIFGLLQNTLSAWTRYVLLDRARVAFIGLTVIGWLGALAAGTWPHVDSLWTSWPDPTGNASR